MIILPMHLFTSDERHAWFHLYGVSRPARSVSKAKKYKMKNSCSPWDSNPQPLDLQLDALLTELTGLWWKLSYESYLYSDTNLYTGISSRMMK